MEEVKTTPYEAIGGAETIGKLVTTFYGKVSKHPDLAPIFPDDLTETARKQRQFLTQFLGGPALYSEEHGHPRLRARHLPFPIGETQAKAWLSCMHAALTETNLPEPWADIIYKRLALTAQHMINTLEENS